MIAHLRGRLEHIGPHQVVIDVGNVGYQVKVASSALNRLPPLGQEVTLFTIQVVREDDISLYGFLNKEERALFALFLSVSGVGPKTALAVISGFSLDRLTGAVAQGDTALLASIPGIGRKTAERIVLELKEKIGKLYAVQPAALGAGLKGDKTLVSDAISALIALGYSPREARETITKLNVDNADSVEAVLKEALKNLA
ncbi:MAG: Holliday junction branch migration protein RuvA [Candidatus Saganbacteria bacterium]|nr:Holliday junction branch migration protein RuvA [Candidatus Saganbacteria bacterium]